MERTWKLLHGLRAQRHIGRIRLYRHDIKLLRIIWNYIGGLRLSYFFCEEGRTEQKLETTFLLGLYSDYCKAPFLHSLLIEVIFGC